MVNIPNSASDKEKRRKRAYKRRKKQIMQVLNNNSATNKQKLEALSIAVLYLLSELDEDVSDE